MSEEPLSIAKAISLSAEFLKKKNFSNPKLEAELLLCKVLEVPRIQLYLKFDQILSEEQKSQYRELLKRRIAYEPSAYIIGEKEFLSRAFYVDKSVLIPRPETELLVEKAIDIIKKIGSEKEGSIKVFEIGVGSGIISISIALAKIDVDIIGNDISEEAIKIAWKNAERHNVQNKIKFYQGNLFEGINEKVDIIISNPPYVAEKDKDSLSKDILDWEPYQALFGGEDGLHFIKEIITKAPDFLNDDGYLLLEIGCGQDEDVKEMVNSSGCLKFIEIAKDYSRIPRILIAHKV